MVSLSNIHLLQVDTGSGVCCNGDFDVTPFILLPGSGVSFDQVTSFGTLPGCNNIGSYNQITISSVPVGAIWSVFELELTAPQAAAANFGGGGLNLTALAWTYLRTSDGTNIATWGATDIPVGVYLNGQRLSTSEYTIAAGVLTFIVSTVVNDTDLLVLERIGS